MNRETFAEQYVMHKDRLVCRLLGMTRNRDVAEDIAAAAFQTALEHLPNFRGESSFYTWVHRIAVNQLISSKRKPSAQRMVALDANQAGDLAEPGLLEQAFLRSECCFKIRQALRGLPAIYRRALLDHFVRGHSIRRIARRQRIPLGTVLSRLFMARKLLRRSWSRLTESQALAEALS